MTATPKRLLRALDARDGHVCAWHGIQCPTGELTPQHRGNRGMGGRPSANTLPNLVWLCSRINGIVESNAGMADLARRRGVKISSHADPEQVPVLMPDGWWLLEGDDKVAIRADEAAELMALHGIQAVAS